jgi:DNA-directed RNA polymerase
MKPVEYLSQKVGKVVPDSDKVYNEGARLLACSPDWEVHLDRYINEAWATLLKYCVRNKQSTYSASVKLTFASDLIGKRIARDIGTDETNIKSTLSLGDLMLETFLQADLIEIFREYEGRRAPYMVRITGDVDAIKPVLIGTSFSPLEPIGGLRSPLTKEPFIKGWHDAKKFHQYLDAPFIRSLNSLRAQGWKLNENVLRVLMSNPPDTYMDLVDEDGEIHRYEFCKKNYIPSELNHLDGTKFLGNKDAKLQRMMSKMFEYDQVVSKAQMVKENGGVFYQEVSCDYRGRVYYAEPFLEFQGNDIARSLFLFNDVKPVTPDGAFWLSVHAATAYNESYTIDQLRGLKWATTNYVAHLKKEGLDTISVDKMSIQDRYNWSESNLHRFRCPSTGTPIFQPNAEKPYAFLAACYEIAAWEMDKENYCSGLPIPIDGSNNGWQHLAAMSKDKQAGALVSLTPSKLQNDFYVAVAKDLVKLMPDWFEERNIPMKHIRKGIAKRGSMTRAYSAGKTRIAKNMYDDCHVEGFTAKYNIGVNDTEILAANLIKAINQVCAGPLKTTKYFQKMAEHELNAGRKTLEWTTPSGFPVIYKANLQHERKQRGTIRGIAGNKDGRIMHVVRVDVLSKETGEKVPCRRSFASGISPNVVHSMDAAHMANTINAFGGTFAAVHDSFATYPSDVRLLQDITKMTFIAQYDVENFFDYIQGQIMLHADTFEMDKPTLGKLDIQGVKDSEYFFS